KTAATARTPPRGRPGTESDRRISDSKPDAFIQPVRPEMHHATRLPFDIDLDGIRAAIPVEPRRVALVCGGVVEARSGKFQYGRGSPRGCNLHREQNGRQHGRTYSARWTPLTRAGSRGNSIAITVFRWSAD